MKGKGAGPGSFRGERGPLPGSPGAGRCVALTPVCPTACRRPPRAPSSPAGPRQLSPHWLHVSLETRQRRCKHRLQNVSFRPAPPPHCHEGSVHLPEASLLARRLPLGWPGTSTTATSTQRRGPCPGSGLRRPPSGRPWERGHRRPPAPLTARRYLLDGQRPGGSRVSCPGEWVPRALRPR